MYYTYLDLGTKSKVSKWKFFAIQLNSLLSSFSAFSSFQQFTENKYSEICSDFIQTCVI